MNTDNDWSMNELWNEVLHENLRRHEINSLHGEYERHPYPLWQRHKWAWRAAFAVALIVLAWSATTDKKDRAVLTPAPAMPTTVVTR